MLNFLKTRGRKNKCKNEKNPAKPSPPPNVSESYTNITDTSSVNCAIQEAEEYCLKFLNNGKLSTTIVGAFNSNTTIQQIVTDKTCLSYFIQFLETRNALSSIKFWLDVENFRNAGEQFSKSTRVKPVNEWSEDIHEPKNSGYLGDNNTMIPEMRPLTDDEKTKICAEFKIRRDISKSYSSNDAFDVRIQKNCETVWIRDAIQIYHKYLSTKLIDAPNVIMARILEIISRLEQNKNNYLDNSITLRFFTLYSELQTIVLRNLEDHYLNLFLESIYWYKYTLEILTGENMHIKYILTNESALFYLMEFLDQQSHRKYLDFWVSACNFRKQHSQCTEKSNNILIQSDALILYEKYFSLQATDSLKYSDPVRFTIEEAICTENESLINCFDLPLMITERYLDKCYFIPFRMSHLFVTYISELMHKIDSVNHKLAPNVSQSNQPITTRHRKSYSDCTNLHSQFLSVQNTLLAVDGKKFKPSTTIDGNCMQIDSKLLSNPNLLWQRRSSISGLCFGKVNALGRYERDFDLMTDYEKHVIDKGAKLRCAVRKLVNLPEQKAQEEIAWQMAEMIVKDVTSMTMPSSDLIENSKKT